MWEFGESVSFTWVMGGLARDYTSSRDVTEGVEAVDAHGSGGRLPFPSLVFVAEDGARHGVYGTARYEDIRAAAEAAGATPTGEDPPGVLEALGRFGRMATREVEEV